MEISGFTIAWIFLINKHPSSSRRGCHQFYHSVARRFYESRCREQVIILIMSHGYLQSQLGISGALILLPAISSPVSFITHQHSLSWHCTGSYKPSGLQLGRNPPPNTALYLSSAQLLPVLSIKIMWRIIIKHAVWNSQRATACPGLPDRSSNSI